MNNIVIVTMALFASLILSLMPQVVAQEKIMISINCFDCPSDYEYLLKVFEPSATDNPKLIGEKKVTSKDLSVEITGNDKVYLDKKFTGKELDFELISLTSGLSNSQSVYIVEGVHDIDLSPPEISRSEPQPKPQQKQECFKSPDGSERYCGYVNE